MLKIKRARMAVKEGFEPSIRLQTVYSLSRGAPSASRPPHRISILKGIAILKENIPKRKWRVLEDSNLRPPGS